MIGEPAHVVIVEPDPMRHREVRPEQAQLIDMRGQRLAPALERGDGLHLRFRHMRLQHRAVVAGEPRRADDQRVGA
jgi:hypothetical protein